MGAITRRKIKLIGRTLRHNQFIAVVMEGKRSRKYCFEGVFQRIGLTSHQQPEKASSNGHGRLRRQYLTFKS